MDISLEKIFGLQCGEDRFVSQSVRKGDRFKHTQITRLDVKEKS